MRFIPCPSRNMSGSASKVERASNFMKQFFTKWAHIDKNHQDTSFEVVCIVCYESSDLFQRNVAIERDRELPESGR